jgi:hypothetical protein
MMTLASKQDNCVLVCPCHYPVIRYMRASARKKCFNSLLVLLLVPPLLSLQPLCPLLIISNTNQLSFPVVGVIGACALSSDRYKKHGSS